MENHERSAEWGGPWTSTVSAPGEGVLTEEAVAANMANVGVTIEQVAEIVARSLASLRVYVVESDITESQNSVRAVVEQATF